MTGFGDYLVVDVQDEDIDPCSINIRHNNILNKKLINIGNDINMNINSKNNLITNNNTNIITNNVNSSNKPTIIGDIFKENKLIKQDELKINNIIDNDLENLFNLKITENEINEDISFNENDEIYNEKVDDNELISNLDSFKHKLKTGVYYRSPDEMEVADEVDTPSDVLCKERFSQYRGLSSMKPGTWDPYSNLPKEYSNIFSFENIKSIIFLFPNYLACF